MPECDICHTPLEQRGTRSFCPACLLREMMGDEDGEVDAEAETVITPAPPSGTMPRLPRYSMIEKLGEGGFANVYRAQQREPVRREVAVKVLKPNVATFNVLARFEAERQTLARMEHPGIARLWDSGVTMHGQPFFAMELVRGEPVTAYCSRYELDLRQRLEIFISICDAVQHAHEKGVLHRDLKPSNILVAGIGSEREVKIIDFGIAKALEVTPETEEDSRMTSMHQTVGTPGYMSPEQSAWGAHLVDARSDLYALGVVLYELITGFTPLQIERRANEEARHRPHAMHITAPSRLPQSLLLTKTDKRDLDAIVLKALETDSARRYASAAAFADDVQRHLRDEPVLAGEKSWTYVMEKFTRRHKSFVISSAVALLAILGGCTASTILYLKEQQARTKAEQVQGELRRSLSRADFATAQRYKQEGDYQSAVACLTRALRHDAAFGPAAVDLQMLLTQEDSPQPARAAIPLDPAWGEVADGAVSAGGLVLAVVFKTEQARRLMLFQYIEGAWQRREIELKAPPLHVALAASGNFLAIADEAQQVRLISVTGETPEREWHAPQPVTALVLSILRGVATVGCQDGTVWLMREQESSPPRQVGRITGAVTHLSIGTQENWVFAAGTSGEVHRLILADAGKDMLLLKLPAAVTALAITQGPGIVAAGDQLGNVACYRGEGVTAMPVTKLHKAAVTALTLMNNGTTLISAGGARDLRVRWYDMTTQANVKPPFESAGAVRRIMVSRGTEEALIVSADSSVRVWRQAGDAAMTMRKPQRARFVAMSATGRCMAVQRDLGTALEVLMLSQHATLGVMLHPGGGSYVPVTQDLAAAAFTTQGNTLVAVDELANAVLWDASRAELQGEARWKNAALCLMQPTSGPMLAALKDGSLIEVKTDGSEPVVRVPGMPDVPWVLGAISADGRAAAWATSAPEAQLACRLRVWWAEGNRTEEWQVERLSALAVCAVNHVVGAGLGNGHVRVMASGDTRLSYLPLHQSRVTSMAFSADGRALITASTDGTAAVWNARSLTPLTGHFRLGDDVLKCTFSGDSHRFACATENEVVVGDVAARALYGHPYFLRGFGGALTLNHTGTRLAYNLNSGEVIVQDIPVAPETPAPEWFLQMADTYVSRRMTTEDAIELREHPGLAALRRIVPQTEKADAWNVFAKWLFTHSGQRQLTPWSALTLEEYLAALNARPGIATSFERRRLNPFRYREKENSGASDPPP
ncbi:MAG: protein kinase domain-containing protein [Prosthecobacter sp.]|uniref:WD40 repeat domain-containing serine/threonine protein kinase n=1 Tax=Prosthecobacter sp. TaxID=1965333 RepID=UPI003900EC0A